MSEHMDSHQ